MTGLVFMHSLCVRVRAHVDEASQLRSVFAGWLLVWIGFERLSLQRREKRVAVFCM